MSEETNLPAGRTELDRRVRLQDVANLAGVSLGSASRALSMPDKVRQKTLEKVQLAARELGYVPHGAARALASRRSMLIGAVLPTISNPIYSDFSQALQKRLRADGYQLLVAAHEYDATMEVSITEQLLYAGVDGLVLVGTGHSDVLYARLADAGRPYICAWSVDEPEQHACVGIDNEQSMREITRHLLDLGHREFGVVLGDSPMNERSRYRLNGVLKELASAGVACPPENILRTGFSLQSGRTAAQTFLSRERCPTALVCTTDLLAAGAIAQAREMGLQVPGDVSVTGFDDVELASLLDPPLTTVRVETAEIGVICAERIVGRLQQNQLDRESTVVEVATRLIVRRSTSVPPNRE